ncbi:MAG: Ycf48-like protein [Chlorobi bacterium OLB6]|nr:MAG: Ycf48-like protein [Chlorobi bacterium OLB6]
MKKELFVAAFCLMCWATPLLAQYTVLVGYDEHQNRQAVKQCIFTSADTVFLVQNGVYRSLDSGRTWSQVANGSNTPTEWLVMFDGHQGIYMSSQSLKKTTNGGNNWEIILKPSYPDDSGFVALGYEQDAKLLVLETFVHHQSSNEGRTWNSDTVQPGGPIVSQVNGCNMQGSWFGLLFIQGVFAVYETVRVAGNGNDVKNLRFGDWNLSKGKAFYANLIHAIDTSTVWVAGSYVRSRTDSALWNKRLVYTTNAGTTWQHANYDFPSAITCIEFITPQLGFVGDTTGNVFVTTDGGQTWNNDNAPSGGKPILSISNVLGKYLHIVGRGVVLRRGLSVTDIQETVPPAARAPLTSVSIRPNPAHATALLDIVTNGEVVVDIEVYNVVGSRAILQLGGVQVASGASAIPLDVTTLAAGMYLCLVRTPKSISTCYFMVE